jgi:hypothetical protein
MVALADWYKLPISPQLGKLSGPSFSEFQGPLLIGRAYMHSPSTPSLEFNQYD